MKLLKPIITLGLVSGILMGCGGNDDNNNNNRFARNNDNNDGPIDVNYDNTNDRDWVGTNRNVNTDRNIDTNPDGFSHLDRANRNGTANNNDNNNRVDVADDVADEVTKVKEVDNAYVLVTNNNAYVAVKLNDNQNDNKLTRNIEQKVADRARKVRDFNNVYVSENPDFYDRMGGYRNDIRNGNPVSGLFDEFNETIRRVFPTAR